MLQVQQTCPDCGTKYFFECPCGYWKYESITITNANIKLPYYWYASLVRAGKTTQDNKRKKRNTK